MNGFPTQAPAPITTSAEKRRHPRRRINLLVEIELPTRGLRAMTDARAVVCNISEGGVLLDPIDITEMPDCFYLRFPHSRERLACYVVNRGRRFVNVMFARPVPATFVEEIVDLPAYSRLSR
ncbi:hypothetical protein GN330_20085 [Nitratireductor sp. CAU 1489]|uniref:PilZ domain-containing protein n=1 Tax=Nitratireductor arenosus TaxID=2682096 RepID=A0A844QNL3_9HYPH|nr:hypothetical protein [Nitratireductor arenosus]MVA99553.1 hypothetical protein [Nitratireductor arenosus]